MNISAKFPCYLVSKQADGTFRGETTERSTDDLPAGDVLIRVAYSSLNYKDALAVTGASGGVGSIAVGILAKLGYRTAAVSGKPESAELLKRLGAMTILGRGDVDDKSGKPMLATRFAGAVDTVGGNTLSTLVRSL